MSLMVDTPVLYTYKENPAKRPRCLFSRTRFNEVEMCQYRGNYNTELKKIL